MNACDGQSDAVYLQVVATPTVTQRTAPLLPVMMASVFAPPPVAEAPVNSKIPMHHDIPVGEWDTGLGDCWHDVCIPNGCMAWCCSCVTLAQIAHRVQWMRYPTALILFGVLTLVSYGNSLLAYRSSTHFNDNHYQHTTHDGEESTTAQADAVVFGAVGFIAYLLQTLLVTSLRGLVRQQFQIPGDFCGDCCCSFCCLCCVAAQMATHVKSYTPGHCLFMAPLQLSNEQLPAYQS